jgi:hypothetical protein
MKRLGTWRKKEDRQIIINRYVYTIINGEESRSSLLSVQSLAPLFKEGHRHKEFLDLINKLITNDEVSLTEEDLSSISKVREGPVGDTRVMINNIRDQLVEGLVLELITGSETSEATKYFRQSYDVSEKVICQVLKNPRVSIELRCEMIKALDPKMIMPLLSENNVSVEDRVKYLTVSNLDLTWELKKDLLTKFPREFKKKFIETRNLPEDLQDIWIDIFKENKLNFKEYWGLLGDSLDDFLLKSNFNGLDKFEMFLSLDDRIKKRLNDSGDSSKLFNADDIFQYLSRPRLFPAHKVKVFKSLSDDIKEDLKKLGVTEQTLALFFEGVDDRKSFDANDIFKYLSRPGLAHPERLEIFKSLSDDIKEDLKQLGVTEKTVESLFNNKGQQELLNDSEISLKNRLIMATHFIKSGTTAEKINLYETLAKVIRIPKKVR